MTIAAALLAALAFLTPTGVPAEWTPPASPPSVVAVKSDPGQTGVRASAYRGRWFDQRDEEYRKCIAQREGRGQYWVTGSNGFYESTYQMTDALVRGAAWEMTPELRAMYPERWRLIRNALLDTPGHLWGRFWMDMAFWTILNVDGPREGAAHWFGGRFTCTPGMPDWGGPR